ncbi:MAG: hypothetical protein J0H40_05750 [Rhizobiales bacterium]|nr:hypothetical protein [Hyphomicrobiales bacterium]
MAKIKITDKIRILSGMRGGCTFAHVRSLNSGLFGGYRYDEDDWLRRPDGRQRVIRYSTVVDAVGAGLIDRGPAIDFHRDQCSAHLWVLTPSGQAAAAALPPVELDALFVLPTPTPPEALETARHKRLATKVLRAMTFTGGRIRGDYVMFVGAGALVGYSYISAFREPLSAGVMAMIAPYVERFADVDGKESLRIT